MMSLFCRSFSFGHIGGRSLVRQSCSATAPTVSFLLQRHLSPVQIASNHKFSTSSNQTESTSSGSLKYYYAPLDRSVIKVSGPETTDFLQGLISNDVRHLLENGSTSVSFRCIYSFILNTSGRIILDLFVYSSPNRADQLLLEVDTRIAAQAVSLLKRYKIRRKVTVEPLKGQVFVLYPESPESVTHNLRIQSVSTDERLYVVQDPRNYRFGFRVLNLGTPIEANNLNGILNQTSEPFFGSVSIEPRGQEHYRAFRYEHGIGEGAIDFEPESVFPFEANAEILNGVSFQKGCYIGQELTARTYHTGVIRKRLLPIQLVSSSGAADLANLPVQNVIHSETGRLMGKFRAANEDNRGLAVLKFGEIFDSTKPVATKYTNLKLSQTEGVTLTTWRPFWWPDSLLSAPK